MNIKDWLPIRNMLNFLQNLTKSAEEKQSEQLHAYVSNALSAKERQQFEQTLANDPALQAEVTALQQLRQNMRQLPQRRIPRNFTLDPALYAKPKPQPLLPFVPAMRVASVLTAVFLVIAIGAEFYSPARGGNIASEPMMAEQAEESVAMNEAADDDSFSAEDTAVELTVVPATETLAIPQEEAEEAMEIAGEMEADVEEAIEEMAETVASEATSADESMMATDAMDSEMDAEMEDAAEDEAQATGGAANSEPLPPAATESPDTPRIMATESIEDRVLESEIVTTEEALDGTAVAFNLELPEDGDLSEVARAGDEEFKDTNIETGNIFQTAFTPIRLAQISLAIVLIGLLMLLQAARMER